MLKAPNRQKLQDIFEDHETIKRFEQLFGMTQEGQDNINLLFQIAEQLDLSAVMASALAKKSDIDKAIKDIQTLKKHVEQDILLPAPKPLNRTRYGVFHDTTTQTAAAINTAYAMTFNSTDYSKGVYVGSPTSRIIVDTAGIYNFQFSAQLDKSTASAANIWIWARVNGVNVADSAGQIRIKDNNSESIAAWNWVLRMNANDYFEIMWEVDDTSIQIINFAATGVHPLVPSVILTVTDNIGA